MRKILTSILTVTMILSLTACGASQKEETTSSAAPETTAVTETEKSSEKTTAETVEETPETSAEDNSEPVEETSVAGEDTQSGKTLVVYYSATGNTEEAANYIAAATGGDVFELEAADPYTSEDLDWTDGDSRVSMEYDNPDLREVELVSASVENWDEYDTVFIGYPIWWGIAAWPVDGFVKSNDFTGKTVIPFCTSSSSGFGESGELLEELAGTGNWLEGERFRSSVTESDIADWIEGLGL